MRTGFALIIALLMFPPAQASLKPGALAANFSTQAAKAGKPFIYSLSKALKKGPVLLYFFPAAFTPGCTLEARAFAEAVPDLARSGVSVIGLASDDIATLSRFSVEECRSAFPVGVATAAILKSYDATARFSKHPARVSYLIAPNGQIFYAHRNDDWRGHVAGALRAAKAWKR